MSSFPSENIDQGPCNKKLDEVNNPVILDYARDSQRATDLVGARQMAFAFDFVLWHVSGILLFRKTSLIPYLQANYSTSGFLVLGLFLILSWRVIFLMKDGIHGFSPGKWAFDLRVVSDEGIPIGYLTSLKRNLLLIIPVIGETIIWLQLSHGRRWLDGWANCRVIRVGR